MPELRTILPPENLPEQNFEQPPQSAAEQPPTFSRRRLLGTGIAVAAAAVTPQIPAQAQDAAPSSGETGDQYDNLQKPFPRFVQWINSHMEQETAFPITGNDNLAVLLRREFTGGLSEAYGIEGSPTREFITKMLESYYAYRFGTGGTGTFRLQRLGKDPSDFYDTVAVISALTEFIIGNNLATLTSEVFDNPQHFKWDDNKSKLVAVSPSGARYFCHNLIRTGHSDFRVMFAAIALGVVSLDDAVPETVKFVKVLNTLTQNAEGIRMIKAKTPTPGEFLTIFDADAVNGVIGGVGSEQGYQDGSALMRNHNIPRGSWVKFVEEHIYQKPIERPDER